MTDRSDWTGKVGDTWAREWRRTDRSFRELTPQLLTAAEMTGFTRALDIGCGAGETANALATRNPEAQILGVDISAELVAIAQQRCADLPNCLILEMDAAHGDFAEEGPPDLLVSRHGVMFFPDPPAAFAHLATKAARSARLVFSCFRSRDENPWVATTLSALPDAPAEPAPGEPGPFAFADPDHVTGILTNGGWHDIAFTPVDYAYVVGEGTDPVEDACDYLRRIGPTARALAMLDDTRRTAALARLGDVLSDARVGGLVALPAAAWIVSARAP